MAVDPRVSEWGNPVRKDYPAREANPPNRNIQVGGGGENNNDSPSSGERTGRSPNRGRRGARGVEGSAHGEGTHRRTVLGRRAAGGDSPVSGMRFGPAEILSSAGPEESRVKQPAPSGKAEHYRETDSEQVP